MKLWMSGEIEAAVADAYKDARNLVETEVNQFLGEFFIEDKANEWAFIAIIREEHNSGYEEVVKRSSRGKTLEFRLKIPHSEFLSSSPARRIQLIFTGLRRSVTLMEKLGVAADVRRTLEQILSQAEKNLHVEPLLDMPRPSEPTSTGASEKTAQPAAASA